MKIEGIILDWAGTSVDYGCFAPVRAFMEIFHEYGIEVTMDETRKPMGMLKWDHIKTMLEMPRIHELWIKQYKRDVSVQDIDAMHDSFRDKLLASLKDYTDLKPYVKETIDALRKEGYKIGSTTGYTDEMMAIVTQGASDQGYTPDYWISPNGVHNLGRPYPYMIFRNMEGLQISDVRHVVKVGDTISDIEEAKAAGVYAIGILEGSSMMGLSEEEYDALTKAEREDIIASVTQEYVEAGADAVILNIKELIALIKKLQD